MAKKIVRIQKNVNPHFKSVWKSKKPYNVLKGGRNSFKSSVIALLLAQKMINYTLRKEKANVVIVRKVGNTIRDSVFLKIQWALRVLGVRHQFKTTVSPYTIRHMKTGSTFYFYGQDDFAKLKSNDINDLIAFWYEEAAEFNSPEEFDQTNATFMRQKHENAAFVQFFWSYNPPRNPYNWINEWAEKLRGNKNYLVHESTYLDDELGFVTEQLLEEINRIKETDYDYYRYLYLGHAVGLGTNVYNFDLFKKVHTPPTDEWLVHIYFATDAGHQQSATTCLCIGLTNKGNVYVLDTLYYSPAGKVRKKAPDELSEDIHAFKKRMFELYPRPLRKQTIDSAEGAIRNQYYKMYGERWNPVAKKQKAVMVDYVCTLLAQGRLHYLATQGNEVFEREHKNYRWDERTINRDNPEVIKEDDHTCDALMYFVIDNLQDLNLKY
ncbi:PBSX family phage terminase large subunit [Aerococcaceae bacterium NML160702]|nr:PBSX family phage terminase large subunit [Aerococcaceae bacterium NML160702]